MDATISDLVEQVRQEIDEITLPGESVPTDSDLRDGASSRFSDEALKDRFMAATRYIAARVRATYLSAFITTVTPSDFDPPHDATSPKILRLVQSTVTAEDSGGTEQEANRRTMDAYQNLASFRVTEDYPVFVFEDFEFVVDNSLASPVAKAEAVRVPDNKYGDVTALPSIFRGALIEHVAGSCFETLRMAKRANGAKARLRQELSAYRVPFASTKKEDE